jgi:hypothetical protein
MTPLSLTPCPPAHDHKRHGKPDHPPELSVHADSVAKAWPQVMLQGSRPLVLEIARPELLAGINETNALAGSS